jgi:hypothetical protein
MLLSLFTVAALPGKPRWLDNAAAGILVWLLFFGVANANMLDHCRAKRCG